MAQGRASTQQLLDNLIGAFEQLDAAIEWENSSVLQAYSDRVRHALARLKGRLKKDDS